MKKNALLLLSMVSVLLFFSSPSSATNVCGAISSNTTWTTGGSPYVATCTVTVNSGVTLTIQAGVTVKFNSATQLTVNGKLTAVGNSGSPIVFTTSSATPAAGQWNGIQFNHADPTGQLSYATVSYAGKYTGGILFTGWANITNVDHVTVTYSANHGFYFDASSSPISYATATNCTLSGVYVAAYSNPTLSNATLSNNGQYGIDVKSVGQITINTATITNNGNYAIGTEANGNIVAATGLTVSGNGSGTKNAIGHRGGGLNLSNETWHNFTGIGWVITANYTVNGMTLTIDPGTVVKFDSGKRLTVNSGRLVAAGTAGSPIVLTTSSASPAPGQWIGIVFNTGTDPTSQFSYVTVSYAGSYTAGAIYVAGWPNITSMDHITANYSSNAGFQIEGSSTSFNYITAGNCAGSGVYVNGNSNPAISNATLTANTQYGLDVKSQSSISINTATITNNGNYAIGTEANGNIVAATGLTVSGNGGGAKNAIGHRGGSLYLNNEAWHNFTGIGWVMTGNYAINGTTLTIDPGTVVKFDSGRNLTVNSGMLVAAGTAGSPIVLTTSSGSPAPGQWIGLYLTSGTDPASQLAYVTVSYAGTSAYPAIRFIDVPDTISADHVTVNNSAGYGIQISDSAMSLSNATVTNCALSGILVNGGYSNPLISNLVLSNNTQYGLNLTSQASVRISTATITNNGSYAMGTEANANILSATNLTVSGNGSGSKNAIEHRGGPANLNNEAWHNFGGLPWIITGNETLTGKTLTVDAGTIIKFAANTGLTLDTAGKLVAVGTAAAPIVMTTASATPAPGQWKTLYFKTGSNATSQVSYVYLSYGGAGYAAGIQLDATTITLDHVSVTNTAGSGVKVTGACGPTVIHSSFSGNTAGMTTVSPAFVIAKLNYWNSPTGPSGSGPGTGQSADANVQFDPWIMAAPSNPNYFTSFTIYDTVYNNTISTAVTVKFPSVLSGNWTVNFMTPGGTLLRTFTGTGANGSAVWDGTDQGGVRQADGTYYFEINSTATTGEVASAIRGRTIIDSNKQPQLTFPLATPPFFSPNNDGVQDTCTMTATCNFDDPALTITIRDSLANVVRTDTGQAPPVAYTWNGLNNSAATVPDGVYTIEMIATVGTAPPQSVTASVTVDNTLPTVSINAPVAGVLSNIFLNGALSVPVNVTITDLNLSNWELDYGVGSSPTTWVPITTGTTAQNSSVIAQFDFSTLSDGDYTLRLQAWDKAGNLGVDSKVVTVAALNITQDVLQFNPKNSERVSYTSKIPMALNQVIQIRNQNGDVVRTLVNISRTPGVYVDTWNGKKDDNSWAPDGAYFYVSTVTIGTTSFTWDLTSQYVNGFSDYHDDLNVQQHDAYNNSPMVFTYNFMRPARVTVAFGLQGCFGCIAASCDPPQFCVVQNEYQETGNHTIVWAGTDNTGRFRPDIHGVGVVASQAEFSKNAVVLYGARPSVNNTAALPVIFNPDSGTQTTSFDVATYQNQATTVKVEILNQASLSVLKTMMLSNQAPGHVTVPWDGRADNGMKVAPGFYTINVTITDPIGNTARGQVVTTIQY